MRTVGPWPAVPLVRRDDVAEAAGVVEDVVPAEREAAVGGPPGERQVCNEPRRVLEGAQERRWALAPRREDLRGGVARKRVDDVPRRHLDDLVPRNVEPAEGGAFGLRYDVEDDGAGDDPVAGVLHEVFHEAAVPLGPGQERGGLLEGTVRRSPAQARGEVVDAGPGGGVVERGAEVVAGGVLGEPEEACAREAAARQPLAHRDPVERGPLGVVGRAAAGDGEGAAPLRVPLGSEAEHLPLEARELLAVLAGRARARVEPLVPDPAEEEALLGLGAEHLLGPLGLAVGSAARQGADLGEERLEGGVPVDRHRDVVRAPGEGRDGVLSGTGVAARVVLQLVEAVIGEARASEGPGGGEAGDSCAENRDPDALAASDGSRQELARPDPVAAKNVRPGDHPAERGTLRGLPAGREEGGKGRKADERGDRLAAGRPHVTRTSATRSRRSSRGPGRGGGSRAPPAGPCRDRRRRGRGASRRRGSGGRVSAVPER